MSAESISAPFPKWLSIATAESFVHERDAKLGTLNPRIHEYFAATSFKQGEGDDAWCAAFVNWCLKQAGVKGTGSAAARSFLDWGIPIEQADVRPGDVCVWKRGAPPSGHVNFFAHTAPRPMKKGETGPKQYDPWCLGGNQSDQVCVRKYDWASCLGIRRPA